MELVLELELELVGSMLASSLASALASTPASSLGSMLDVLLSVVPVVRVVELVVVVDPPDVGLPVVDWPDVEGVAEASLLPPSKSTEASSSSGYLFSGPQAEKPNTTATPTKPECQRRIGEQEYKTIRPTHFTEQPSRNQAGAARCPPEVAVARGVSNHHTAFGLGEVRETHRLQCRNNFRAATFQ